MSNNKANVTVIDYGTGNLLSLKRAFEHVGAKVNITNDHKLILNSWKPENPIALQNLIKVGSLIPIALEASAVFIVIIDLGSFNTNSPTIFSDFLNSDSEFFICLNNLVDIRLEYLT